LIASDPKRFPPTPGSQILPSYWAVAWNFIADHPDTPEQIAVTLASLPHAIEIVRRARERGIDVLAGTDTLMPWIVPGESLHLEIARLARAFGDNEAALAAATTVNGLHIAPGQIGVIAPGARADILLLPADPVKDLGALRAWKIEFVGGRRYDRTTIDAWIEVYRRHFHSFLYSHVMNGIVAMVAHGYQHTAR
jgi:cytosine/adenosine deaminase-related metal-dependent hydrolase